MQLTVELSLHPFNTDYKTLIKDFIAELNKREGLVVKTSVTSTMIHGEYGHVMETLSRSCLPGVMANMAVKCSLPSLFPVTS